MQRCAPLRRAARVLQVKEEKNDKEEDKGDDEPYGGMIDLVMGGDCLVTRKMDVRRIGE